MPTVQDLRNATNRVASPPIPNAQGSASTTFGDQVKALFQLVANLIGNAPGTTVKDLTALPPGTDYTVLATDFPVTSSQVLYLAGANINSVILPTGLDPGNLVTVLNANGFPLVLGSNGVRVDNRTSNGVIGIANPSATRPAGGATSSITLRTDGTNWFTNSTANYATAFGGDPKLPIPPVIDNFALSGLQAVTGDATRNFVPARAYFYPFTLEQGALPSALQTRITEITGGAAYDVSLGLYTSAFVGGFFTPDTFVVGVTSAALAAAADLNLLTGLTDALPAGRYFLAILAVLSAGAGDIRGVTPVGLNTADMGALVKDRIFVLDGQASLPAAAAAAVVIPAADQVHWMRGVINSTPPV